MNNEIQKQIVPGSKEYVQIHYWLKKNFGKASKCESHQCSGKSKAYSWAKITDKEYDFKRENFIELCRTCHTLYDFTEETRRKIIAAQKIKPSKPLVPIIRYDSDGKNPVRYKSLAQACIENNARLSGIMGTLLGYNHTSHGYIWKYADPARVERFEKNLKKIQEVHKIKEKKYDQDFLMRRKANGLCRDCKEKAVDGKRCEKHRIIYLEYHRNYNKLYSLKHAAKII